MMINWSNDLSKIHGTFTDTNGNTCLIQENTLLNENVYIRLGVLYEPDGSIGTPMKLNIEQVKQLLPLLNFFIENKCLPCPDV